MLDTVTLRCLIVDGNREFPAAAVVTGPPGGPQRRSRKVSTARTRR
jgi:hypothetical protein